MGGGSGYSAVADTDLTGGYSGNATGLLQVASTVTKIGYVGTLRYIRVVTTASASAALLSAEVIRGHLRHGGSQPV